MVELPTDEQVRLRRDRLTVAARNGDATAATELEWMEEELREYGHPLAKPAQAPKLPVSE